MAYTFRQFCEDSNRCLKQDPGEQGREGVRLHLEKLLAHPEFIDELFEGDVPVGRHIILHDKETDMYVLAHVFEKAGGSPPHDHGPHWVVYGNVTGYTDMTEWKRVDDGSKEGYAELDVAREYRVESGSASVFDAGDIHSIRYPENTRFIRVTGGDVESAKTLRFDVENKTVRVEDRGKLNRVASGR